MSSALPKGFRKIGGITSAGMLAVGLSQGQEASHRLKAPRGFKLIPISESLYGKQ
jgi:hypothetical protein